MRLVPGLWRSTMSVLTMLLLVSGACYLVQGYMTDEWWSTDYVASLLIPIALFPAIIWGAFVPKKLEFTDQTLTIQFFFRKSHILPWNTLTYWGSGHNVFVLQFSKNLSFQIYSQA